MSSNFGQNLRMTIILSAVVTALCQIEDPCTNPFGQIGSCISLKKCSIMYNFIMVQPRPWSMDVRNILRAYHCGFEGRDPKICCSPIPGDLPGSGLTYNTNGIQGTNANLNANTNLAATTEMPSLTPPSVEGHPSLQLLPTTCGTIEEDRLFGGNSTGLFEFPWMTLISFNTARGRRFACGGTIINGHYILTAAHCVTNLGSSSLAGVRVGDHNIMNETDCQGAPNLLECAPPYQDFTISEIIPHKDFIGSSTRGLARLQNDIALIRINGEIDFSKDNVQPICLPTTKQLQAVNLDGQNLVVTGWGATEDGTQSDALLKIYLPLVPNAQCAVIHNRSTLDGIGIRQLCAGGILGVDSCGGDSGGPLKFPTGNSAGIPVYVQYGIVSFGPRRCGSPGVPGVYTNVVYYVKWILDQLKP